MCAPVGIQPWNIHGAGAWVGPQIVLQQPWAYDHGFHDYNQYGAEASALLDEETIHTFLDQLGVLPGEEHEFRWVAELGLQSPLPPKWSCCVDPSTGYSYYVDNDLGASFWENPLLPYLRQVVQIGRLYLQNYDACGAYFVEKQKTRLWEEHMQGLKIWHGPFNDFAGRASYVNTESGIISTQDPRMDAQYIFELQSSFIDTMAELFTATHSAVSQRTESSSVGTSSYLHDSWMTGQNDDPAESRSKPTPAARKQRWLSLQSRAKEINHCSVLEKMRGDVARLEALCEDEEEIQRLSFSLKLKARKARRKHPNLGKNIADVMLNEESDLAETLTRCESSAVQDLSVSSCNGFGTGPCFSPNGRQSTDSCNLSQDDGPPQVLAEREDPFLPFLVDDDCRENPLSPTIRSRRTPAPLSLDDDDCNESPESPTILSRRALKGLVPLALDDGPEPDDQKAPAAPSAPSFLPPAPLHGLPSPVNKKGRALLQLSGSQDPATPAGAPPSLPCSPSLRSRTAGSRGMFSAEAFLSSVAARPLLPGAPVDV
eukprot:TRINITY_DN37933_c0_g1_i1.p1 TRINITY_DN37933_c0_g1~~TRINITY_DN37933_c0_g1_i1.p1  ORF type:complete len:543 (+),score=62.07 TRINITY_DN37933_c0_g1_i1:3-1631(+)